MTKGSLFPIIFGKDRILFSYSFLTLKKQKETRRDIFAAYAATLFFFLNASNLFFFFETTIGRVRNVIQVAKKVTKRNNHSNNVKGKKRQSTLRSFLLLSHAFRPWKPEFSFPFFLFSCTPTCTPFSVSASVFLSFPPSLLPALWLFLRPLTVYLCCRCFFSHSFFLNVKLSRCSFRRR